MLLLWSYVKIIRKILMVIKCKFSTKYNKKVNMSLIINMYDLVSLNKNLFIKNNFGFKNADQNILYIYIRQLYWAAKKNSFGLVRVLLTCSLA